MSKAQLQYDQFDALYQRVAEMESELSILKMSLLQRRNTFSPGTNLPIVGVTNLNREQLFTRDSFTGGFRQVSAFSAVVEDFLFGWDQSSAVSVNIKSQQEHDAYSHTSGVASYSLCVDIQGKKTAWCTAETLVRKELMSTLRNLDLSFAVRSPNSTSVSAYIVFPTADGVMKSHSKSFIISNDLQSFFYKFWLSSEERNYRLIDDAKIVIELLSTNDPQYFFRDICVTGQQ